MSYSIGIYTKRYNELVGRYEAAESKPAANQGRRVRREKFTTLIDRIGAQDGLLAEFDEGLWTTTAKTVTVPYDRELDFRFRGNAMIS